MLYSYEERIIENIIEPIPDETLNKYIHYSWSHKEICDATQRLETNKNILNEEQKYVFNEVFERIHAKIQLTAFIQGRA